MKRLIRWTFLTLAAVVAPAGLCAQTFVPWADLVDAEAQVFEDPYRQLTTDQIERLRRIALDRQAIAAGAVEDAELAAVEGRLQAAEAALSAEGLDADWLISQRWVVAGHREAAANAGNTALDGQSVVLTGFVIPAPPDPDGAATVYLVQARGMCSHMPPPLPNQLVRVRLQTDWQPEALYQPVRLAGALHIDPSEQAVRVVDGPVAMKATWRLDAVSAAPFTPARETAVGNADWIAQLRARVTAASGAQE